MNELTNIIRRHREDAGINARALAALSGVSVQYVSDLNKGKETLDSETLSKVLESLGIRVPVITDAEYTARRVKAARDDMDLDQITGAALCGVSPRLLSKIENAKPRKRLSKLFDVLNGFGVEIEVHV